MNSGEERERILVVDDSADTLEVLQRNLSGEGYRVLTAGGVEAAIEILRDTEVDLVLTDLKMPGISGMELVRHVRENLPDTEVMMITGFASVNGAVEAVKSGAEEYLGKPFTDEELSGAVRRVLDKLHRRRLAAPGTADAVAAMYGLIGGSSAMGKVFGAIDRAATTTATILITGESGTGKELVARAIHYRSRRAAAPFVPVNCGAIPDTLFESELFGHVKGAFTGATESRAGFFQTADGGSIFLDEIGETGPAMQVKLLRVLQDREVCMVGANRSRRIDVRILAATNKSLAGLVKKGAFREDLFFRISVIEIEVPPLRDRGDDILVLANHFLDKHAGEADRAAPRFSDDALQVLNSYHWPGNVRELENLVQRLVVMVDGPAIDVPDLPSHMRFSVGHHAGLTRTLAEVEAEHIRNVLASVDGNKTKCAEILGIDRKTLRERLKR
jgi:DNA-binding NtrC family response regulator